MQTITEEPTWPTYIRLQCERPRPNCHSRQRDDCIGRCGESTSNNTSCLKAHKELHGCSGVWGCQNDSQGRTSVSGHDPRADNDFVLIVTTVCIVGGSDSSGEQLVRGGVFVRWSEWRRLQTSTIECIADIEFAIGFSGAICNIFTKCDVGQVELGSETLQRLSITLLYFFKRATT